MNFVKFCLLVSFLVSFVFANGATFERRTFPLKNSNKTISKKIEYIAQVINKKGRVKVAIPYINRSKYLRNGDKIAKNSTVYLSKGSILEIKLATSSIIYARGPAVLKLAQLDKIYQSGGIVTYKVEKSDEYENVKIKLGFGEILVKGTIFDVGDGADKFVKLNQGAIKVSSNGIKYDIKNRFTGQIISSDSFDLVEGESASIRGKTVLINNFGKNNPKKVIQNSKYTYAFGLIGSFAYVMRKSTFPAEPILDEQLSIMRIGLLGSIFENIKEPFLLAGYTTDPQMDELFISFGVPHQSLNAYAPYDGAIYSKYNFGIGSTHSTLTSPSHLSLGLGVGYLNDSQNFRFLSDLNFNKREWKFERTNQDEERDENEFSLNMALLYKF